MDARCTIQQTNETPGISELKHTSFVYSMAFHTEEDFKSKKCLGEKVYILAKDVNTERKFEIKAKKNSAWKRPIFCTP